LHRFTCQVLILTPVIVLFKLTFWTVTPGTQAFVLSFLSLPVLIPWPGLQFTTCRWTLRHPVWMEMQSSPVTKSKWSITQRSTYFTISKPTICEDVDTAQAGVINGDICRCIPSVFGLSPGEETDMLKTWTASQLLNFRWHCRLFWMVMPVTVTL